MTLVPAGLSCRVACCPWTNVTRDAGSSLHCFAQRVSHSIADLWIHILER